MLRTLPKKGESLTTVCAAEAEPTYEKTGAGALVDILSLTVRTLIQPLSFAFAPSGPFPFRTFVRPYPPTPLTLPPFLTSLGFGYLGGRVWW